MRNGCCSATVQLRLEFRAEAKSAALRPRRSGAMAAIVGRSRTSKLGTTVRIHEPPVGLFPGPPCRTAHPRSPMPVGRTQCRKPWPRRKRCLAEDLDAAQKPVEGAGPLFFLFQSSPQPRGGPAAEAQRTDSARPRLKVMARLRSALSSHHSEYHYIAGGRKSPSISISTPKNRPIRRWCSRKHGVIHLDEAAGTIHARRTP